MRHSGHGITHQAHFFSPHPYLENYLIIPNFFGGCDFGFKFLCGGSAEYLQALFPFNDAKVDIDHFSGLSSAADISSDRLIHELKELNA